MLHVPPNCRPLPLASTPKRLWFEVPSFKHFLVHCTHSCLCMCVSHQSWFSSTESVALIWNTKNMKILSAVWNLRQPTTHKTLMGHMLANSVVEQVVLQHTTGDDASWTLSYYCQPIQDDCCIFTFYYRGFWQLAAVLELDRQTCESISAPILNGLKVKYRDKCAPVRAMKACRRNRVHIHLFLTLKLEGDK